SVFPVPAAPLPAAFQAKPVAPPPVLQAQPLPPPTTKSGSRRGLYMALGSLATLLVLAAAIIEGPKLLHSGASSAAPQAPAPAANKASESTSVPAPASPEPVAQPN